MTVHSDDRPSWLMKLDRITEISAENRSIVFNNIGHLLHADMLKEQFHKLDGTKAIGIDKVTKVDYGKALDDNIESLIKRLRRGTYRPKPARITEIPKEDGSTRTLAISCLEDKLVQLSVSTIKRRVDQFLDRVKRIILRWLNRRGGNRKVTWERFGRILQALGFPKSWKTVSMF
jgi:RNA-directed DNA polymerase